jgi:hypothetical protein
MDFTTEIVNGSCLMACSDLGHKGESGRKTGGFLFTLFNKTVRTTNLLSLEELFRIRGPKIWNRVGDKLAVASPYFSCMCKAMIKMLELNEEGSDGWLTANIAWHSGVHELARIMEVEGLLLEHYGLTHVGQLFERRHDRTDKDKGRH